jgi:hypothetical protein
MSDFVSRLAARAVGDAPRARPAVAPEVAVPAERVAREAIHEATVARATPTAPAVRSEPPEARIEPAVARARRPAQEKRSRVVEHSAVAPKTAGRGAARPSPPPAFEPAEPRAQAAPTRAPEVVSVVPAAPVAAAPIVRRVVESRLERVHAAAAVAAEPPVRVHIGRLEVRANVEQPPRQPTPPRPARRPELTLSDYLRGRRSA